MTGSDVPRRVQRDLRRAARSQEVMSPRSYRVGQGLLAFALLHFVVLLFLFDEHLVAATIIGCGGIIVGALGWYLVSVHGPVRPPE